MRFFTMPATTLLFKRMTSVFGAVSFSLFTSISVADEQRKPVEERLESERIILVTAEFEETSVLELPSSVSVIDEELILQRNAQHFSDVLNLAANVNFASGASRGRFIQVRGIGERSEFSEPVNYSVGVVVDGIDLTGIATAATMLDVQQVEILRGPQGTLYGANGLAGLINVVSNSPTDFQYTQLSIGAESYDGHHLSAVVSDTISKQSSYRAAVGLYQSNGFMENVFLQRDDTNNLDELSAKVQFVNQFSSDLSLTSTLFYVDIDNGYDAFSLDSNRDTYSDKPGYDRQQTLASSFRLNWDINQKFSLQTLVSLADSKLAYGYDEDWSHPGICDGLECDSELAGFDWWYASFDRYQRDNKNTSLDIRLLSNVGESDNSWVLGLYTRAQEVNLERTYTYLDNPFLSDYETTNSALYGQINMPLAQQLKLTTGLRFESRNVDYSDSNLAKFSPREDLWGGKVSLEYHYAPQKMLYALISRGYKAGGFNTDGSIDAKQREFETEFMWNYEAGIKGHWLDNAINLQASVFYQDRKDIQTKQSIVRSVDSGLLVQEGGECPCSFTDFTGNAAEGVNYGAEIELLWRASEVVDLYSSLGILKTEFKNFQSFTHINADLEAIPPVPVNLDGRAQAHAPEYQLVVGANYYISEFWMINSEVEAKDKFYFSDRHNEKSSAYELLNLRLTYRDDNWRIHFYAHNALNKDVQTRGFGSFGNDPRKFYQTEAYYQFAAPRVIGFSASVDFE